MSRVQLGKLLNRNRAYTNWALNSFRCFEHLRSMALLNRPLRQAVIRSRFAVTTGMLLGVFILAACTPELAPLPDRQEIPQPTFVAVEVTPAPESPTATPWPFPGPADLRAIPDGLDPELFTPAEPEEVVNLWTDFLTGTMMGATSNRFLFRGQGRFDSKLHLCPDGNGYMDGDPSGDAGWFVSPSVGEWYEVALTHEIPGRLESVTFVLGIQNGLPVRAGSTTAMEFIDSSFCSISDPGKERPSFTVEDRRLDERVELVVAEVEEIPWIDGEREFPEELSLESAAALDGGSGIDYWNAYLSGGVVDAVAYNYGTFVLTEAFSGSLHLCGGRVAVLEGTPSGVGEWAVQPTASNPLVAKILFTLPGDRAFRTLVLGVASDGPVLLGRDDTTGLIAASPLDLRESDECGE